MNWKEKLNEIPLRQRINQDLIDDIEEFIETEIIEKMIEDAANFIYPKYEEILKQQLKSKWLTK